MRWRIVHYICFCFYPLCSSYLWECPNLLLLKFLFVTGISFSHPLRGDLLVINSPSSENVFFTSEREFHYISHSELISLSILEKYCSTFGLHIFRWKTTIIWMGIPLWIMWDFFLIVFKFFCFPLLFRGLTVLGLGVDFFGFFLYGICSTCWNYRFQICQIWGVFSHYFFEYLFSSRFSLFFFEDFDDTNVRPSVIFAQNPEALLIFSNLFSCCCSNWVKFIGLPSSWLILFSIISTLLTKSIQWVSTLMIVFFSFIISIWFVFITSFSLLNFSIFLFLSIFNCLFKHFLENL